MDKQFVFRCGEDLYEEVRSISVIERRKLSDVARLLLERGIAAYKRDGHMIEEDWKGRHEIEQPPTRKTA